MHFPTLALFPYGIVGVLVEREPIFNSAAANQFLCVSDSCRDSLRGPVEVKHGAGGGGNGVTMGGLAVAGKNRTEGLGIGGAVAAG